MRLIQSSTNSSFFRIQFLTPERQWAPVCYDTIQSINFCNTFGYNSIDVKEIVTDNVHTYTKLDCPPNSTRVEQCTVRLFYDYISIYGCTTILEIYCSNLEGKYTNVYVSPSLFENLRFPLEIAFWKNINSFSCSQTEFLINTNLN